MKRISKIIAVVALSLLSTSVVIAGNDDRRGTAGATELLVNPWARSAGWGSVCIANVKGLESFSTNIAGLSFVQGTEISYSFSSMYGGKSGLNSGASLNAFGIAQRLFERGVAGVFVSTMSAGNLKETTVEHPEGVGTFSPTLMNINVAYAHSFTRSIHGGAVIKIISETTADVKGSGFGIDAGIQYVTGENDNIRFGISLRNLGPAMSFEGTGMAVTFPNSSGNNMTVEFRSGSMELPTCLNIGASYDILFEKWEQRLTLAGAFTSNAFLKDNFTVGVEYSLLDCVMLRCGYVAQKDIFNEANRTTANTGFSAGGSFKLPLSKDDDAPEIEIDYAYRMASPLKGTHTFGAIIRL